MKEYWLSDFSRAEVNIAKQIFIEGLKGLVDTKVEDYVDEALLTLYRAPMHSTDNIHFTMNFDTSVTTLLAALGAARKQLKKRKVKK